MGVRGLTQHLKKLEKWEGNKSWESWELKETNLIIDGGGLCFYFYENPPEYKLNCEYGGEYSQLQGKVKEFFERLKSNEVRPYIVFDGIVDEKFYSTLGRANSRIRQNRNNSRPGLTKQTILQTLEELEVPYVVADFDADSDIASLANIMDCPVMAKDSDFLIFDIRQGYIPFNSYTGQGVNVKRFFRNQVAERLSGIQPDLLPLLASLLGNDYVSEDTLKPFKEKYSSPKKIVEFLSKYDSFNQAMTDVLNIIPDEQRKDFQETVDFSVQQYQTKENNLHIHDYFTNSDNSQRLGSYLTSNKTSIPHKIVELYRSGKFGKQCMSIMCHNRVFLGIYNTGVESTNQIRRNVYKILIPNADRGTTPHKLTEYRRDGPNYGAHVISIETQADDMSIDTIENTSEDDKVTYLLQTTLSCELDSLKNVPKEWWLVVAVLRYWYLYDGNKQLVTEAHLKALLVYQVNNNAEEYEDPQQLQEPHRQYLIPQEPHREDLQEPHAWQYLPQEPHAWQYFPQEPHAWQDLPQEPHAWQYLPQEPHAWQYLPQEPHAWQDLPQEPHAWQELHRQDLPQEPHRQYLQEPHAWQYLPQEPRAWQYLPQEPHPWQYLPQEPHPWQYLPQEPHWEDLQGFLQWQDVVFWADILYSLLCINSLPVLRPAKLYDGEKVWKLYTNLHNGIQAEEIVIDVALFQQLYAVVLEDQVKS